MYHVANAHLLILQLVLPEELLHHEGDALHAGDGVALVVEVEQVTGLSAERQEEANTLRPGCQHIQILQRNNRVRIRNQKYFRKLLQVADLDLSEL